MDKISEIVDALHSIDRAIGICGIGLISCAFALLANVFRGK